MPETDDKMRLEQYRRALEAVRDLWDDPGPTKHPCSMEEQMEHMRPKRERAERLLEQAIGANTTAQTKPIRIPVAVNSGGAWFAEATSESTASQNKKGALEWAASRELRTDFICYVEADIPIPPAEATVRGRVVEHGDG